MKTSKIVRYNLFTVSFAWLSNVSCDIVEQALLHFIYRDSLIHDKELYKSRWSPYSSVSETFAAKLLAAAEKFDLSRLKLMCESVLCNDISTDTVVNILLLADRNHATELKFACLKFAVQNLHGEFSYSTLHYRVYKQVFRLCYILIIFWQWF